MVAVTWSSDQIAAMRSSMAAEFAAKRPAGGARVILVDLPWPWAAFSAKGHGKSPEKHYSTMPIEALKAIPLEILAAKDCAVFFWCTWPLQEQWAPVYRALGFRYRGLAFEWRKFNPKTGKYAFGPGYGTRKNLEPCLLLTKGNPKLRETVDIEWLGITVPNDGARSVRDFIDWWPEIEIRSPRREHSRKPPEQYDLIETMFDGPYVEVFSRSGRPGWTSFGDQLGLFEES